jgi:hydrogenase maturation protein HypF
VAKAYDLHISGIVQGVGFRPFVYRQARRWGLAGWVLNAGDGVHAHLEGEKRALEGFLKELGERAPAAAHITSLEAMESPIEGLDTFSIRESDATTETNTLISPDIATCPECLRELFDPGDRRFHYPFINCTNCGPRFTIIGALPYDRPNTSMAGFTMCESCNHEYHDPLDRRFHAQPDACFTCGPTLRLYRSGQAVAKARDRAGSDALIEEVASLIVHGRIVAIKGLGGYHLACDATNEDAVVTLRKRKRRTAKPFALMVRGLSDARALCQVDDHEAALLEGTVRPIVLLRRRGWRGRDGGDGRDGQADDPIAPSVAGTLHELGIMLPSTPVQHLLMALVATPLVMTSGNISEEPIIAGEIEAHESLAQVADAFLDNDREILSRYDDSVVRVIEGRTQFIRRARGFAPQPLPFFQEAPASQGKEATGPSILAVGPEQKNTFCLVRANEAFCSQHLGDLENASSFDAWLTTLGLYERLFSLDGQILACDMHPEYLSTKWARARAQGTIIEVQHHHAHIASVLAEHRATGEPMEANGGGPVDRVIGIAFDGTGYGDDGALWGGETLIVTPADYERFAHLRYVPLPGGRAAIDHPDRMAWSYLRTFGLTEHQGVRGLVAGIGDDRLLLLDQIIANRINTPDTSSMGRLFDAVSALVGICAESSYEGQAAVELEAALYDPTTGRPVSDPGGHDAARRYRFKLAEAPAQKADMDASLGEQAQDGEWRAGADGASRQTRPAYVVDPTPTLLALLDDRLASVPPSQLALRFHEAVAQLVVDLCERARLCHGLSTVALGGGVFMNRYLITRVVPLLENEGFTVLLNRELPVNDGCISYGQAAVAAARLTRLANEDRVVGK